MTLPLPLPTTPMLARLERTLPTGELLYEPKWDGFRCIVSRDGQELALWSRNGRPLTRYFPELVGPLSDALPDTAVVDGELLVVVDGVCDFDALSARIHPAASRVRELAAAQPASMVVFDLLALGTRDLRPEPLVVRRAQLTEVLSTGGQVALTPATTDPAEARRWLEGPDTPGIDGVVAKPLDSPYRPGERGWWKIKRVRTAECVVGGFRWHADGEGVGSLLLGLYDAAGQLRHVGVAASLPAGRRRELVEVLTPLVTDPATHPWGEGGTEVTPRGPHRWNRDRDTSWVPVRPELVVEVAYDKRERDRFRHTARLLRLRPDRDPRSCTYDQLA